MKPFLEQFAQPAELVSSQVLGTQTGTHVVSEELDTDEDFPRPRPTHGGTTRGAGGSANCGRIDAGAAAIWD
jgi:hypothetical protein